MTHGILLEAEEGMKHAALITFFTYQPVSEDESLIILHQQLLIEDLKADRRHRCVACTNCSTVAVLVQLNTGVKRKLLTKLLY